MNLLETDRLVLRHLKVEDADFILDLLNQPSFLQNIGDRGVHNLQEAENYIRTGPLASYAQYGFGLFLVEMKDTHTAIGICGLIKREVLREVDIGFAFLPQYWSQGFAHEASSAVMAYGREVLKLERIIAIVAPGNNRSIHLLEKIGLKFERMMTWPEDGTDLKLYGIDIPKESAGVQVHLRKATPEDYTSLCKLFDQIDALHREFLPGLFQKPVGPVREIEYYLGLLADADNALFVAEMDRNLCGVIHSVFRQAPEIPILVPRTYVVIDSIVVKAESRKHGIGQKLMEKAQEWALQRGATSIELNVYDFNQPAIAFYRGLGFETLSRKMSKILVKPDTME